MAEIIRNRTIRPSTRKASSVNYRIDLTGLAPGDILVVNISHESKSFRQTFKFSGSEVLQKKSLGFKVTDNGEDMQIRWTSTQPTNVR